MNDRVPTTILRTGKILESVRARLEPRCRFGLSSRAVRGHPERSEGPAFASCAGQAPRGTWPSAGFTLIELIIVISIMLILISIAAPIYRTSIIRSREAVLRDNLFTMRALIDQYTVDKQEAPQSLQDLVAEGYLRDVPVDPFTGANNTWEEVYESDVVTNPDQTVSGITDVRSGSSLRSLNGDLYSSW